MKNNFFSRLELLFWNFAIQALGYFRTARSGLSRTGQLSYGSDTAFLVVLMTIAGVAGLFSGYLFYMLTASLR
jgi:hypothetical protein